MPELSASEGAVVIIDPLTKVFATDILGGRVKFQASKSFLLELHRKIYKIHHAGEEETPLGNSVNVPGHELDPPKASATDRRNLPFNLFAPAPALEQTTTDQNKVADDIVEEYIKYRVQYNEYLVDGVKKFTSAELASLDLVSLIERFDSMKFLRAHKERFPTICLLARSVMGKFSNNGFQERVFSVAGNAMNVRQCRMAFSHLEKRTVLANNKQLFQDGIFKGIL